MIFGKSQNHSDRNRRRDGTTCVQIAGRFVGGGIPREQDPSWQTLLMKLSLSGSMYELLVRIDNGMVTSSGLNGSMGLLALFAAALSHLLSLLLLLF